MAKCSFCGSMILFGGVRDGEARYCNDECHQRGALVALSHQLPEDAVRQTVTEVHQGRCPECEGPGPVDVFTSYKVWSVLVMTSWSNQPRISCRGCATKRQLSHGLFSLLLGWWGIPWGLVMTPVQLGRNLAGLGKRADSYRPSDQLEEIVRLQLAMHAVENAAAAES